MSVKVMNWVFENSRSDGYDRLVLLALADRTNDAGLDAWPSVPTIAAKSRMDARTVRRCLVRLEALGELQVERRQGRSSRYAIIMQVPLSLPLSVQQPSQAAQDNAQTPDSLSPLTDRQGCPSVTPDRQSGGRVGEGTPGRLPSDPSSTYSTHTPRARAARRPSRRALAFVGRPPVPRELHDDFIDKLGGDLAQANTRLQAWYRETDEAWRDQEDIGDDDFAFWRLRFREWLGTTRQPRGSRRSGRRVERDPLVVELLEALGNEGMTRHDAYVWFGGQGGCVVRLHPDVVLVLVDTPEHEAWIRNHYIDVLDRACARAWPGRTATLAVWDRPEEVAAYGASA
jgi:hypothetical protein